VSTDWRSLKVESRTQNNVKFLELASNNEVDVDKYVAYLRSTFDQVLDALGLVLMKLLG